MRHSTSLSLLPILCLAGLATSGAACSDAAPTFSEPDLAVSSVPPPPVSGGTLLVTHDNLAVAADPDRDRVWIAGLDDGLLHGTVTLEPGDEPGRVVEDGDGLVHVALRRGGAVVTIDPHTAKLVDRTAVCGAPRGLAYDSKQDAVVVACTSGELVTLPAKGGKEISRLHLEGDLRDVIVSGDKLLVSRFRSAELLSVHADGTTTTITLPSFKPANLPDAVYEPSVAWRAIGLPDSVLMVHQRALATPVTLTPGSYYGSSGCDGAILHGTISVIRSAHTGQQGPTEVAGADAFTNAALPVDVAATPDGRVAMIAYGSARLTQTTVEKLEAGAGAATCFPDVTSTTGELIGSPEAVAFSPKGVLVMQLREPAGLDVVDSLGNTTMAIRLPGDSRADTAHDMFHLPPNGFSGIACASCHPEGHDDGRTWKFKTPAGADSAPRRTQNIGIGGGLLKTAPFHWNGDLSDMTSLMGEVFVSRMGGQPPGPRRIRLMSEWLDQLPAPAVLPAADTTAIARGKQLFESAGTECATCHNGPALTNNKTVDVGTGAKFQVPSLIGIGSRAPLMHNGCVASLHGRFVNPCAGGDKHGKVTQLEPNEVDDLVAYLGSL